MKYWLMMITIAIVAMWKHQAIVSFWLALPIEVKIFIGFYGLLIFCGAFAYGMVEIIYSGKSGSSNSSSADSGGFSSFDGGGCSDSGCDGGGCDGGGCDGGGGDGGGGGD